MDIYIKILHQENIRYRNGTQITLKILAQYILFYLAYARKLYIYIYTAVPNMKVNQIKPLHTFILASCYEHKISSAGSHSRKYHAANNHKQTL